MAVTAASTGTQTAVIGTEYQVADTAIAGVYTFHVDTNAMVAGDILQLRAYQMVLTSGTSRVIFEQDFYGAQPTDEQIKVSLPIGNDLTDSTSLRFSIKQTFGTGRAFPWKLLKY